MHRDHLRCVLEDLAVLSGLHSVGDCVIGTLLRLALICDPVVPAESCAHGHGLVQDQHLVHKADEQATRVSLLFEQGYSHVSLRHDDGGVDRDGTVGGRRSDHVVYCTLRMRHLDWSGIWELSLAV